MNGENHIKYSFGLEYCQKLGQNSGFMAWIRHHHKSNFSNIHLTIYMYFPK